MNKIKNLRDNYLTDLARLADTFLIVARCPGGRPIRQGFVCPHCGMDTSHGDCDGVQGFEKQKAVTASFHSSRQNDERAR